MSKPDMRYWSPQKVAEWLARGGAQDPDDPHARGACTGLNCLGPPVQPDPDADDSGDQRDDYPQGIRGCPPDPEDVAAWERRNR